MGQRKHEQKRSHRNGLEDESNRLGIHPIPWMLSRRRNQMPRKKKVCASNIRAKICFLIYEYVYSTFYILVQLYIVLGSLTSRQF